MSVFPLMIQTGIRANDNRPLTNAIALFGIHMINRGISFYNYVYVFIIPIIEKHTDNTM